MNRLRNIDMAVLGSLIRRGGEAAGPTIEILRLVERGYVAALPHSRFEATVAGNRAYGAWANAAADAQVSLTPAQQKAFGVIERALATAGVAPSFREMRDALGLRSTSEVHRLLKGLEERGWISRLPYRRRAIVVRRAPQEAA